MSTDKNEVKAGNEVVYTISLDENVVAANFDINYNSSSLELIGSSTNGLDVANKNGKITCIYADIDGIGTIMYGSSVATSDWLGLGKESNFAYGIYDLEFIPEALFDVPYRKSLTTIFPRFLLALSKEHSEELEAYFKDVYGFEGSIEDSVSKLIGIFESFGLDMYFNSNISDEDIKKSIDESNSGGLDLETALNLIKSCIKKD